MYLIIKRIFDIFCSLIGIIVMIPITIVLKIVYLLYGDKHSIFYKQRRVGKDGKEFNLYKYRTMVYGAEEVLEELLLDEKLGKEWEENHKLENDPRITKIGWILRKTSIDELPQFINVLKNDMSVIGPRPLVPGELKLHGGDKFYESIKPGITGWWAVNGRNNTSYQKRLELEYYYIKHRSLMMDIAIIFMTFEKVFTMEGAK